MSGYLFGRGGIGEQRPPDYSPWHRPLQGVLASCPGPVAASIQETYQGWSPLQRVREELHLSHARRVLFLGLRTKKWPWSAGDVGDAGVGATGENAIATACPVLA